MVYVSYKFSKNNNILTFNECIKIFEQIPF